MSSRWELDDGIKSIKSAWQREHTARANLEKMLENAEAENAKLRELCVLNLEWAHSCCGNSCKMQTDGCGYGIDRECNYEREIYYRMRELGVDA